MPVVYGYFLKRCGGDHDLAVDLAQDSFLSALRTVRRSGEPIAAPMPWIVTIARRRFVDYVRRSNVRRRHAPRPQAIAVEAATTASEVRIISALSGLSPTQRLAVTLYHVDGLPVATVAATIGKSVRATESLLARGRSALRRAFEEAQDV